MKGGRSGDNVLQCGSVFRRYPLAVSFSRVRPLPNPLQEARPALTHEHIPRELET
jgi:hypothetical protein